MNGRERIEHIIVLMLENRSFDHLLGFLNFPDSEYPPLANVSCPVDPDDPQSELVTPTPNASSVLGVDPSHSHEQVELQLFGRQGERPLPEATMNGFIKSYRLKVEAQQSSSGTSAKDIMKCFSPENAPVLSELAQRYAVFTRWHSSVPGETWPNRNYAHAATSDGEVNIDKRWYSNRTIFEQLSSADQEWGIYHEGIPQVWAFWRLWTFHADRFHGTDTLIQQITDDELPAYAFVEPNHGLGAGVGNSQHPSENTESGDSFVCGERLIGSIYNSLVDAPAVFDKTLLLITYDEHGGFFDRVKPHPAAPPDDKIAKSGFDFSFTGVRVPAVAVSPLIPPGPVEAPVCDHASIPKTVRAQFAPAEPPLTRRDADAADFLATLPLLDTARADAAPIPLPECPEPQTSDLTAEDSEIVPQPLSELEASLAELTGAVKTELDRRELPASPGRAELMVQSAARAEIEEPAFAPSAALKAAAETRRLGTTARAQVAEVLQRSSLWSSNPRFGE